MIDGFFRSHKKKNNNNNQQDLFKSREKGGTETKRVLEDLKMSKLKEIFAAVAIVCHRNEVLAGLKMFSQLFSFGQIKALKKNISEKLNTRRKRRKEEAETKCSVCGLKNA